MGMRKVFNILSQNVTEVSNGSKWQNREEAGREDKA